MGDNGFYPRANASIEYKQQKRNSSPAIKNCLKPSYLISKPLLISAFLGYHVYLV